ncbi:uncharacterized protein LOC105012671 isoform X4 [Esox lucius]|uniref:uncharacterized protein LOC105012671 isoform X4 n=1 Tax=Esox lucius TaxID=8010 RepID=UPI0014777D2F|nr:uncharacterized protein LOC105012671 isoform X4 [Esox lucius]
MVSPRSGGGTVSTALPVRPVCSYNSCGFCGRDLKHERIPQLLPCLHSVCRECVPLSELQRECPVCGSQYFSSEITDNPFFSKFSDLKPRCGGCDEPVVCGWCAECVEPLCSVCVAAHKRVKLTREHSVLFRLPPGFSRAVLCPIHSREQMKLFCVTCDQLTCRDCQLTFHREHKYMLAQEALPQQREWLQYLMETVKKQRPIVQQNLLELEGRLSDLEDLQESLRAEVKDILKVIWRVLVKRAMQLSKEMQDLCRNESECVTERQAQLRKLGERQEYVLAFTENTLKNEDQTLLLSCKRQIHAQLQGILAQTQDLYAVSTMKELKLYCHQDFFRTIGCFGEIVTKEVPFARLNLKKTHGSVSSPIQISPPTFSLEKQRKETASSTLSPSSQDASSMYRPAGQPYHYVPHATRPSSLALSSCSDSPLSVSSTSAVNATNPLRSYKNDVNAEDRGCLSLSAVSQNGPVPCHRYPGGTSETDLVTDPGTQNCHAKRKSAGESVGPENKRYRLPPLKIPADSSCERDPPVDAENQIAYQAGKVMKRKAMSTNVDRSAVPPVDNTQATKVLVHHQSNHITKTASQVVFAPFKLPVTRGPSAASDIPPSTLNAPPSTGYRMAVPPYLVISNTAPVSSPTANMGWLDNKSLVFIPNGMIFQTPIGGVQNQLQAGSVPEGKCPQGLLQCVDNRVSDMITRQPASPPTEAPQSQSTDFSTHNTSQFKIRMKMVKTVPKVQITKQPAKERPMESGLCQKDEVASTFLVDPTPVQTNSIKIDIAQTEIDLFQKDSNLTVVQNETHQAKKTKNTQMEIVPAQAIGIKENQVCHPVKSPMQFVRADVLDPSQTVHTNQAHSVQNSIVQTDSGHTKIVNISTQVSSITIKDESPATYSLSVTGPMQPMKVIMSDTPHSENVQTDHIYTERVHVTNKAKAGFVQTKMVRRDSVQIGTPSRDSVQTGTQSRASVQIETVQTEMVHKDSFQNETAPMDLVRTDTSQVDPVWTETVQTEMVHKDSFQNETALMDPVRTDMSQVDPVRTETVQTEMVHKDSFQNETAPMDPVRTDTSQVDPVRTDTSQVDPVRTDTSQVDPVWTETVQTEMVHKDSFQNETAPMDLVWTDTLQVDPVRTETVQTEMVHKDSFQNETAPMDLVRTDTSQVDPVWTETVQTEMVHKDSFQNETALMDPVRTDMSQVDPVRTETVQTEMVHKDSFQNETAPMDPVRTDTSQVDPVRTETVQTEMVHKDSFQNETAPMDLVWTDTLQVDPVWTVTVQTEMVHKDSFQNETALMDPVRTDMSQVDPVRTDTSQVDPVWTETVQTETVHKDSFQNEMAPMDPVRTDTSQVDPVRTDTSQVDPVWTETVQTETVHKDSFQNETAPMDPVWTDTSQVDTVWTETVQTETVHKDSVPTETVLKDSVQTETVQKQTETMQKEIETANKDSVQIKAVQIEREHEDSVRTETVQPGTEPRDSVLGQITKRKSAPSEFAQFETGKAEPVAEAEIVPTEAMNDQTGTAQMKPAHYDTGCKNVVESVILDTDRAPNDFTDIIQTEMSTPNKSVELVPNSTLIEIIDLTLDLSNDLCSPVEEDDVEMDNAVKTAERKDTGMSFGLDRFLQVSLLRMPFLDAPLGAPSTCFSLTGIKEQETVKAILKDTSPESCSSSSPDSRRSTRQRRPHLGRRKHCTACKTSGKLIQCVCGRGFHKDCHIPPVSFLATLSERWRCMLCRDLSDPAWQQDYSEPDGEMCMSPSDQMRCERLLLVLSCKKYSFVLYRQAKRSSPCHYMNISLIRGRLLRKLVPPYRTPSEFVSDVWFLLHLLLKKYSKSVNRLRACFRKELGKLFEGILPPSLLVNPHQGEEEEEERSADPEENKEFTMKGIRALLKRSGQANASHTGLNER